MSSASPTTTRPRRTLGARILCAEDDAFTRVLIEKHLTWSGFTVEARPNGAEAWETL
jgi:CheY-like chemotaxis protein